MMALGGGQFAALAAALALDGGDYRSGALEIEDGVLELAVQHGAIQDHQHGIEQFVLLFVVQIGEEMRGEGQQRFGASLFLGARMTVEAVLIDGILDRLGVDFLV